ncbi:MAG: helix-turn-helix domain-containing protein [Halanaerobiales bacterium]
MKNNIIGSRLKKLRYNLNLTQEKLGEKADLHYSYIGQVERGDKTPSLKALIKIAEALNISLEELIHEETVNTNTIKDVKIKNINKLLSDRTPEELDLIYKIIRDIFNLADIDKEEKTNIKTSSADNNEK